MASITLGYWNISGLVEGVRLILHHAGVEFEDKRIDFKFPLAQARDTWLAEKYNLGLEFPNLPYYIEGDVKITQSLAIARYLAKKHGLYPKSDLDAVRSDILEQTSRDILISIIMNVYGPEKPEPVKQKFNAKLMEYLKSFSDSLGGKEFFVADTLTYVDFLLYDAIEHASFLLTDVYEKHPNLATFAKRIEALPNIKKYIEGGEYKRWPLWSPFAHFGFYGEAPERKGI